jgi:hypothetical protein
MTPDPNAHREPKWELVRMTALRLFAVAKDTGTLTKWDVDVWRATYPDADSDRFLDALRRHARTGAEWMPRAPQLAAYLAPKDETGAPLSWIELWHAIEDGCKYCRTPDEAAATVLELTGSVAGEDWTRRAWTRIQHSPLGDEQGGAIVASFRKEWEGFSEVVAERVRQGRPAISPSRTGGQLRRFGAGEGFGLPAIGSGEAA